MDVKQQIKAEAAHIFDQVVAHRRHLHAHPELSFEEVATSAYVARALHEMGIPTTEGIGGYGVVGLLEGEQGPGPVVALRADMDALPITEENEVPYRSQNPGVMHACGHDVHTSSLLGTARILSQLKAHFKGTIKLIFQPAEEKTPGGASLMIQDGVLAQPQVESIFGQHVLPYMDKGKVGIRRGMYMASADEIYLRVIGKGGHAAQPSHFIDPVAISAQIITALQQVVSRSDPRKPTVLSFGKVIAEGATNVIPDEVYIEGTLRCMNEAWRAEAKDKIRRIAQHVAEGFGGRVELDITHGYPVLYNHEQLTDATRQRIVDYVGEAQVVDLDLWMAAEDFAYYTHEVPGCFYRIGTRNEAKGLTHGLHTPRFDIDESVLELSTGLMAWIALQQLADSAV